MAAPGDEEQAGDHAEQAEGHVDEEDEPPPTGRQEQPSDGWAEGQPDGLGCALDPDRLAERGLGTASTMMATLLAWSRAAPTAWRARKPIRAPRLGARPQRAEPMMKMPKP